MVLTSNKIVYILVLCGIKAVIPPTQISLVTYTYTKNDVVWESHNNHLFRSNKTVKAFS